jgi:hypothetical protein
MSRGDAIVTERYEGWNDSPEDPDLVRRFAIPPFRWETVEKARFPERWRREDREEFERRCSA